MWVGKLSDYKENLQAMELSVEYAKAASDLLQIECSVWLVYQSEEIVSFAAHFVGWDWTCYKDIPDIKPSRVEDLLKEYNRTYTYEQLKGKKFPKGLDTSKLEVRSDLTLTQVLSLK